MSSTSLWIFGYGSLVWRPAFSHLRACPASIEGHARRFWQGSTDHRGLPGQPGRVVTLIPERATTVPCWGTAYEIPAGDPEDVMAGLDHRERGGYDRSEVSLSIRLPDSTAVHEVEGLVYVAGPDNENYLGPASISAIAQQIAVASGPSGPNPEYVSRLAARLREMDVQDAHVFAVEAEVNRVLAEKTSGFE